MTGVTGSRLREDREMSVDVRSDSMPLDVLPKFTDAVSEVSGRLIGVVAARGTPRKPSIAGAAAVDFASFRVVPMGVTLRNLFGALRMRGDTVVIDSLAGRAGGGRVSVTGGLATADLSKLGFDLRIAAEKALVMDTERGRIRTDAEIAVKGPYDDVHVTGQARIVEGVVWIPESSRSEVISANDPAIFNVVDTSVVTDRELLPGESPLLQNLRVDVSLDIARDTWVRGRDANVEIYTPDESEGGEPLGIHVNRRRSALAIEGRVNTDRGEYTFLGRRFILRQGSATFIGDPEINPLLQITGVHEVRLPGREALEIRVIIGGTLRHPRIGLESSSQPPMSESDLLSYLAFGQSSTALIQLEGSALSGPGTGSGNLVGNVAGLAARQLAGVAIGVMANEAERDLGRSLGADVFNISPADVPAELSGSSAQALLAGTEVEIGRYINRSTFIALQARPSAAVPGIRVQHRMAKGFRIETSYEPRVLLSEPTLSREVNLRQVRVFGGVLIREWRF
jgi:translocation and assembly module TamB